MFTNLSPLLRRDAKRDAIGLDPLFKPSVAFYGHVIAFDVHGRLPKCSSPWTRNRLTLGRIRI